MKSTPLVAVYFWNLSFVVVVVAAARTGRMQMGVGETWVKPNGEDSRRQRREGGGMRQRGHWERRAGAGGGEGRG